MAEWVTNFLSDDHPYYADDDESYLPEHNEMPGGDADGMYDDIIDDGILESLIILTLAGTLVFLIYYRQQRQLAAHARNGPDGGGQQGEQIPQGQPPQPGDRDQEFAPWVAEGH